MNSSTKPYDKAFADLVSWLKANGLIVRIPKNGPIRIERVPKNDR